MTKEEIMEGMKNIPVQTRGLNNDERTRLKDEDIGLIFTYLASQGAVLKVEGKMADTAWENEDMMRGWVICQKAMRNDGYTLTEPLI